MQIGLTVDGTSHALETEPAVPLLYVLRNALSYHGPKYGCGAGQCGACTVLVEGVPVRSCVAPVGAVDAKAVTTVASTAQCNPRIAQLREAFAAEQAAQCGYCSAGMIVSAAALLEREPDPAEHRIRQALDANLCRCGAHNRIVRAIQRAARALR